MAFFLTPPRQFVLAAVLLWILMPGLALADSQQLLEQSVTGQLAIGREARDAQLKVAKLAEQTSEAVAEYRAVIQQLDRVKLYNTHLQDLVRDQEAEKSDIDRQLKDFEVIEQGIVPLMLEMIDDLDRFVSADLPFNLVERRARIDRLRDNLDESDISVSEKYRQIMDAYQIETSFGREVEASTGTLELSGQPREVDFFRVGRVLLAYQTKDQSETGFFNKLTGAWEILDDSYRPFIARGLKIARKQSAPDLLKLPIVSPEAVR